MADLLAGIGLGCDLVAAVVIGLTTAARHREASKFDAIGQLSPGRRWLEGGAWALLGVGFALQLAGVIAR